MTWVIIIIGIILLFVFPKQMGILIGVAVAGIGATYLYLEVEQDNREKQRDAVAISVRYDTKSCSVEFPLFVTIKNGSKHTVNEVSWDIGAFRQGYSNDLVDSSYSRQYSRPYSSDKILGSGQWHEICYKIPTLTKKLEPQNLHWSALNKSIDFRQD